MSKFTFINEQFDYDEYTGEQRNLVSKTTREFHGHTLEGVLDEMTAFLRGAGYHFDGHLDVVSYESEINKIDDELDDLKEEIRSQRVFEHIVKDIQNNPISFKATDIVSGSNDWDTDVVLPSFSSNDINSNEISISTLSDDPVLSKQFSFDFTEQTKDLYKQICSLCKIPLETMQTHQCFDDKCPSGLSRYAN